MQTIFRVAITVKDNVIVTTSASVDLGGDKFHRVDTPECEPQVFLELIKELAQYVIVPEEETQGAV